MKKNVVLYQEIAAEIKQKILNGSYPVGVYIPSEPELEKLFNVSKVTIRQAVALLAAEGYVKKQRGKGTRVISNRLFNKLSKAKSFSKIIEESGLTIQKKILSVQTISPDSDDFISPFFTGPIMHIKRLYSLDSKPYIFYQHYIHEITTTSVKNLDQVSLYQFLKENNQVASSFNDTFEVVTLQPDEKKLLQTNAPMALKRTRKTFNDKEELIELSIGVYNTEHFPYTIEYEI